MVNGTISSAGKIYGYATNGHYDTMAVYSSGWFKIKIIPATSWMLAFTVRIYEGYRHMDIAFSGYNYGTNKWYSPYAYLLGGSHPNYNVTVYFGYDSDWNLWVAIPALSYAGIDILNVTNGYTQMPNLNSAFSITYQTSLTGTIQTSQVLYTPLGTAYGWDYNSCPAQEGRVYFKFV